MATRRGEIEPHVRGNVVLQHSLPQEVRRTEARLSLGVSLLGSESKQANRLGKVLRYSRSLEVRYTKLGLCACMALFGGESEPAHCLDDVLRYSRSLGIRLTEDRLGVSASLFRKKSNASVHLTEHGLCTGVALLGGESEPTQCLDEVPRYTRAYVRPTEADWASASPCSAASRSCSMS